MNSAEVHGQITEQLFQRLEESNYLHVPMMNLLEGRIRSKAQLERYISVLVHKLEQTNFRDQRLIGRIDQLIEKLERFERQEQGGARSGHVWDSAEASLSSRGDASTADLN